MRAFLLLLAFCLAPAAGSMAQLVDVVGTPRSTFYTLAARGDTLFAGGEDVVYVSADRGDTWAATAPVDAGVVSIDAFAATDAGWFVGTLGQGAFRSTDRGASWALVSAGLTGLGALHVSDFAWWGTKLYASTDGAGVFELDLTAPHSWRRFGDAFAHNEAETVPALALHGTYLAAAAGGNGLVFGRNLEGGDWHPHQLVGHVLSIAPTGLGVVAATTVQAFIYDDGEDAWRPTGPVGTRGLFVVVAEGEPASPPEAFLAMSTRTGMSDLFRSRDPDRPWEWLATVPEVLDLLVYGGRLYLAQVDGLRMWAPAPGTDSEPLPGVEVLRLDVPAPHPVAGTARLDLHMPAAGHVRLEVADVLGRRVAVLQDAVLPAGSQQVVWNAAGLAPGVYFLSLTAGGQHVGHAVVVGRVR